MPFVDHARKEIRFKVVYYGPGLGGKTTNLEQIHRRSRPEQRGKLIALNNEAERTLFFDFLPMELGRYKDYLVRVHLCTVPGQFAHDETRRLVLRHVDGIVFVVDSQHSRIADNVASIQNLETNLKLQGDNPTRMPTVVQFNKRDLPSAAGVATLRQSLKIPNGMPQVLAAAAAGQGVFETLKAIVKECLSLVEEPSKAPSGRSPSIVPGQRASMFPQAPAIPRSGSLTLPPDDQ